MIIYIYGLYSSADDTVRYVGRTKDIKRRLKDHTYYAMNPRYAVTDGHKNKWIRKTIKSGYKVLIKILETTTSDEQDEREIYWVSYFGRASLTNATDGGKYTGSTKPNISEISFPKIKSHLVRNNIRAFKENLEGFHKVVHGSCNDSDYVDYRVLRGYSDLYFPENIPITIIKYREEITKALMRNVNKSMLNYKALFLTNRDELEIYYESHYLKYMTYIPESIESFIDAMDELDKIRLRW